VSLPISNKKAAFHALSIAPLLMELLQLQTVDFETFKQHKQIGDAYLRCGMYNAIFVDERLSAHKEIAHLAQNTLGNADTNSMAQFFDTFAPLSMKINQSGPDSKFIGHSKADYVEALIHYTHVKGLGKVHSFVVRWLVSHGMQRLHAANATSSSTSSVLKLSAAVGNMKVIM
jgi:hypothetical protein